MPVASSDHYTSYLGVRLPMRYTDISLDLARGYMTDPGTVNDAPSPLPSPCDRILPSGSRPSNDIHSSGNSRPIHSTHNDFDTPLSYRSSREIGEKNWGMVSDVCTIFEFAKTAETSWESELTAYDIRALVAKTCITFNNARMSASSDRKRTLETKMGMGARTGAEDRTARDPRRSYMDFSCMDEDDLSLHDPTSVSASRTKMCISTRAGTEDHVARDPRSYMDIYEEDFSLHDPSVLDLSFLDDDELYTAKFLDEAFPPPIRQEDDLQSLVTRDPTPGSSLSRVSSSSVCSSLKAHPGAPSCHTNACFTGLVGPSGPLPETVAGNPTSSAESTRVDILRASTSNALWPQSRVWGISVSNIPEMADWPSRFKVKRKTVTTTRVGACSEQEENHLTTGRPCPALLRKASFSPRPVTGVLQSNVNPTKYEALRSYPDIPNDGLTTDVHRKPSIPLTAHNTICESYVDLSFLDEAELEVDEVAERQTFSGAATSSGQRILGDRG